MKSWWAVSKYPAYDWGEPPDEGYDVVLVLAPNKRRARIEAARKFRETKARSIDWGACPFSQFKIERACCPHGAEMFDEYHVEECPICDWDHAMRERFDFHMDLEPWEQWERRSAASTVRKDAR